ncbi:GNAT family N-acetyltransferase [Corynebacterium epidermidicanis]|uniref:Acetyltransferase (GNAT) domain n=1 Tax=Corynebacterium epidermidicanis TaxID=1050174 RepID=A0A0G3GSY8_9CORY|nr:hypothetical protein [Corynebacterium epidermidicanis]AKK02633.1 Acetyltransferase (GNAT) domain [Corynebacterium epidermidicanis]
MVSNWKSELLSRYDEQLRTHAEVSDASEVARIGPLWLATYPEVGRGLVTYAELSTSAAEPAGTADLVRAAVDHFAGDPRISEFEWKTRGHDHAPQLIDELLAAGFELEEEETVMVGPVADVISASDGLPAGFELMRAKSDQELLQAHAVAYAIFGKDAEWTRVVGESLVRTAHEHPGSFEMWFVRSDDGEIVCSGRVVFVENTDFAGLWGGACREEFRGRGIYRALTAARAESAMRQGKKYLHSDSTKYSRPILERAGLHAVTTSIPAVWRR